MSPIRLSLIIPARNEEALIGEVLEAILASVARSAGVARCDLWLPETPFEVIVADDASEDGTTAIVRDFVDRAGVRLVRLIGGTCAAARNAGVDASSGRVLCFVDADTIELENVAKERDEHFLGRRAWSGAIALGRGAWRWRKRGAVDLAAVVDRQPIERDEDRRNHEVRQ